MNMAKIYNGFGRFRPKRISKNGFHHERPQRWMVREKKPGHLYFQKKTREQGRNISGRLFSHFYCQ